MPERLDAINGNHWNVMLVTSQQLGVAFNVDLFKRIFFIAVCRLHRLLSFIAQMTAWARIKGHLTFYKTALVTHKVARIHCTAN
ncbi:MAG TPA: hypothetical protein VE056_11005 [Pyrinomonadaceae bacterium]|nr:hypothetical protein [Pyrinomonadaceae bacterium]